MIHKIGTRVKITGREHFTHALNLGKEGVITEKYSPNSYQILEDGGYSQHLHTDDFEVLPENDKRYEIKK